MNSTYLYFYHYFITVIYNKYFDKIVTATITAAIKFSN